MLDSAHFLRPLWLLALIPLLLITVAAWRHRPKLQAWSQVCDSHLLEHLAQKRGANKTGFIWGTFLLSMLFMILSAAGPVWHQLPTPTYKPVQPRVLVLDLSEKMLEKDLTPDRLARAKFKLQDLFSHKGVGQFGLVVFTGEPFVVSPLTDDAQTIESLLPMLTPEIMPVDGQKLDSALAEASKLLKQAGYDQGEILVLTADSPSTEAIELAKKLAAQGVFSSIMPMRADNNLNPLFDRFAVAGRGELLHYASDSSDLELWLTSSKQRQFVASEEDDIPLWRDEGPWFLIPALLLLLPLFRRGWLQQVTL